MFAIVTYLSVSWVGGWSDLTSKCALANAFVSESLSGPERQWCMTTVCVFVHIFGFSRDIHTVAVHVVVLMEPTSAELCKLSKLGALLKWVGVPEANAPAIRKEWFSMYGANETAAASVSVRLPPF